MKQFVSIFTTILLCIAMSVTGFAHSGRTDSSGGHKDKNNVSGLGSYHYHHGYPAHLHPNGVCPYATTTSTSTSTTTQTKAVEAPKEYLVYTDIVATIDGNKIQSYNYNGETYVDCNHLNHYGFDVSFDSTNKTVIIKRNANKALTPLTVTQYSKGKIAYEIKASAIKVYKQVSGSNILVTSLNGGGNTYIKFSELSSFGSSEWNNTTRTASLKLS